MEHSEHDESTGETSPATPTSPSATIPLAQDESSSESTPGRVKKLTEVYETCNFTTIEPERYEDAAKDEKWVTAMNEEIRMIEKNNTWELVDHPKDKEIIGVKWVYKTKLNPDDSIQKYKARLVAKGYSQQPGVEYNETFSHVARLDTIRALVPHH
ncbi:uncharacterized mitochondrial protein AtMg00820-like [Rutidosis leptorrhynchoides]|uniref:uncharacterized mitochondrial protein AtMg00820-like n=1 Tax=Rutidosis leptorrhynchoides TaxID=125765 RepID=UPI003A997F33